MRGGLPSGTVTFLFTDIEGSTALLHRLGEERYAAELAAHRGIVRAAVSRHSGAEVDTQGDAFFVAFATARDAIAAARDIVEGLEATDVRVRMGLHTGTPLVTEEGYVGVDVHRAARIAACGHGGQVLVSAATAALVDATQLKDLGDHRLKDLSAPERIFQLGEVAFPPLRTLYRTNLPVPATPFVGRDDDVVSLAALIRDDDSRLVTVVGPGGIGKTRLALQAVAAAAESAPDGLFWVPLASLADPSLVPASIAEALGSADDPSTAIGDRRLLLLLDNFEHLMSATGHVRDLLAACRHLQVVVTSRQLLRLAGEHTYEVGGLPAPDAEALFVARARALDSSFRTSSDVVELCEQLDDLPLALELAAARMRVLTPRQLIERLSGRLDLLKGGRDGDARQQTLRTTIAWSHDLLTDAEKTLFAQLAVFAGGWRLDAAEAVTGADLDTLESLVDKSLVRVRDGGRFWMLESILEYASEQLGVRADAADLRRKHAFHFLEMAEAGMPRVYAADRHEWMKRVGEDRDNFRRAFAHLEDAEAIDELLRILGALGHVWAPVFEALEWLERALERSTAADSSARARALRAAALLHGEGGDPAGGAILAREALTVAERVGDRGAAAEAQWTLGFCLVDSGAPAGAEELLQASIDGFTEVGNPHAAVWVVRTLAYAKLAAGKAAEGRALHEENLERARAIGNRGAEATTLGALAMLALNEERVDDAVRLLAENLPVVVELGTPYGVEVNMLRIGAALACVGDASTAATLMAWALVGLDEGGYRPQWISNLADEAREIASAQVDEGTIAAAETRGRALSRDEAIQLATASLAQARG